MQIKWTTSRILLLGGSVVLLVALIGVIVRYFGPTTTVHNFFSDVGQQQYANAVLLMCPDQQDNMRQLFAPLNQPGLKFDPAKMTYDLQDENLSTAHVRAHGTMTISYTILNNTTAVSLMLDESLTLLSSGLGWCIASQVKLNPGTSLRPILLK